MKKSRTLQRYEDALAGAQNADQLKIIWDSLAHQMCGLTTHNYVELTKLKQEIESRLERI